MLEPYKKLKEETTSSDIAYAPGVIKPPTPEVKKFVKDDSEEMNKRQIKIKEAMDSKIPKLKSDIVKSISRIVDSSRLSIDAFTSAFKNVKDVTPTNTLLKALNFPDDILAFEKKLPDDVGELELILTAIKEQTPLGEFDAFENVLNIYGAKLEGYPYGAYSSKIVYQGYIDSTYRSTESIFVSDVDTLEKIEDVAGVKVVGKNVYPVGGLFNKNFFKQVVDITKSEEKENEDI